MKNTVILGALTVAGLAAGAASAATLDDVNAYTKEEEELVAAQGILSELDGDGRPSFGLVICFPWLWHFGRAVLC